jgi:hypothetical protein
MSESYFLTRMRAYFVPEMQHNPDKTHLRELLSIALEGLREFMIIPGTNIRYENAASGIAADVVCLDGHKYRVTVEVIK